MIGSQDSWVQMPVMDLYDTQMMLAAVNAARDMYNRSEERMKDFNKEYGDFITPIQADQDWYNQNVTGRVRNAINHMYAAGIDPLRSAEGRAAIASLINNIDTGSIAKLRMSKAAAEEYLKRRGELTAKGLYSPDMEKWANNGLTLENWNTLDNNGIWTRTSPIEYKSMDDIIEPIVSKIDPSFDAELTARMNDGYNYSTVSRDRILGTINDNMNDLTMQGTAAGYYYNKALQAAGGDPNAARALLKEWYANRASNHIKTLREEDKFALDDRRTANDIKAEWAKESAKSYYDILPYADSNGDGKLSQAERAAYAKLMAAAKANGGGRGNKETYDNIFREADRNIDSTVPTEYIRSEAHYQKIQPKLAGVKHSVGKEGNTYYEIPASQIGKTLYTHDSVYDTEHNTLIRYTDFNGVEDGEKTSVGGSYYFKPTGNIKAKKIIKSNGRHYTRYFISGTLQHSAADSDVIDAAGSPKIYEMEVTERDYNYGKKQEKQ